MNPPALISPPDGTILMNPGEAFEIPLRWTSVNGADSYQVIYRTSRNPIPQLIVTSETSLNITLSPGEDASTLTVQWSVQSLAEGAAPSAPSLSSFSVGLQGTPLPDFFPTPTPLPAPVLIAPPNGSVIRENELGRPVSFQWQGIESATRYDLQIYLDNKLFFQTESQTSQSDVVLGGVPLIQKNYQWQVRAIDANERPGAWSLRSWFQVGSGVFPTPTPAPGRFDLNQDGEINGLDLFYFAQRYQTNDPLIDYDNDGLNTNNDLLMFLRFMPGQEPPIQPASAAPKP